ncbi:MAG: AAA domain-containing protein [Flavobacteriaceae bacterium]|nr:AAA domain-containing protein [Flavobacteriaceae bacterium]
MNKCEESTIFNNKENCDLFTELIQAYLKTDSNYRIKFEKVWLWDEFPYKKSFGNSKCSIDIVAQLKVDKYYYRKTVKPLPQFWAIKSLFFKKNQQIVKSDLTHFLIDSSKSINIGVGNLVEFSNKIIITTTNFLSEKAKQTIENQIPKICLIDRDELSEAKVDWGCLDQFCVYKKWMNYWKISLSDSQRMKVEFKKEKHYILKNVDLESGIIPFKETDELFKHKEKEFKGENYQLKSIDIFLSVFTAVPRMKLYSIDRSSKKAHPFWIQAKLNREGFLSAPKILFPIIPREYLLPSGGAYSDFILGDVFDVDRASGISNESVFSGSDDESEIKWKDYIEYIYRVFFEVSGEEIDEFKSESYTIEFENIIFSPLKENNNPAKSIIDLYNHLILEHYSTEVLKIPRLLKNLVLPSKRNHSSIQTKDYMNNLSYHIGQMGDDFPLSFSQRKTLNTYISSEPNTVFTVNGPPGTGKTSLLRSIVADEIVKAAIKGDKAPIILACATTNQAVTNIIENFSKTESSLNELKGRWIPDFKGYGTYLSKSKNERDLKGINFIKTDNPGTFAKLEDYNYLPKAKSYFLKKINAYKNRNLTDIDDCFVCLREEIIDIKSILECFSSRWHAYLEALQEFKKFRKKSCSHNPVSEYTNYITADQNEFTKFKDYLKINPTKQDHDYFNSIQDRTEKVSYYFKHFFDRGDKLRKGISWFSNAKRLTIDYYKKEKIIRKIGCWLRIPTFLKSRKYEIGLIFENCPTTIIKDIYYKKKRILQFCDKQLFVLIKSLQDLFYHAIEFCDKQIDNVENDSEEIIGGTNHVSDESKTYQELFQETLDFCDKQFYVLNNLFETFLDWKKLCESNGVNGNPLTIEKSLWEFELSKKNDKESLNFYDEIDIKFRHKAFQLAVHYWEARWLSEVSGFILDEKRERKGQKRTIKRWQLRSMLTPCYVSTFHMAPKFFSYFRYDENEAWVNPPLKEFIDVLLIDDASQTTPEVGVPCFSLAKKAVVVGDVKQLEPVWNVPYKIDVANLESNRLSNGDSNPLEGLYESKGVLASNGSIMKMAQIATPFKESDVSERGLFLREHRRCYDEIIDYCNTLAYDGKLMPMRGPKKNGELFPAMGIIHVNGSSKTCDKQRFNEQEVEAIISFLVKYKSKIELINNKSIEEEVGIITPFVAQKKMIIQRLKRTKFDVNTMKIGTVHALQGAERPIILFSSVYGPGDVGTMFFDRDNKPNMLNVAVSRAQNSFIVFGNKEIFKSKFNSPSGVLGRYLNIQ